MLPADLLAEWELTVDAASGVPGAVHTADGRPAVLKIVASRAAATDEALALQHWHGRGAVRLLRADPGRGALLVERLGPDLADAWDVEACGIVGGLVTELRRPAPPQLRRLSSYAGAVGIALRALPRSAPLPPRMVEQAAGLAERFARDERTDGTLIHGDLHYGTVREGEGRPWLAISPRPWSGDPHHEAAPLLWHRYDELAGRVRDGLRARFHAAVDAAALDEHRARDWVVVRAMDRARLHLSDRATLTQCVSVAKAVQD